MNAARRLEVDAEPGLVGLCALCENHLARAGSALCSACWLTLRLELRDDRPRRPAATYCECGGGELHHLCGRPDYRP